MAHFYGTIQGQAKTKASRRGSKGTGLEITAASWSGAVEVRLYEKNGVDMAEVSLKPWHGKGRNVPLYHGPVSGWMEDARQSIADGQPIRSKEAA